jgi:DNA-binding transcriptional LysR family regulator
VSDLEAHLRTRLIKRTSRRLTLTDAGRSYVAACKRILEDIGEAERAAAGEYMAPRGDLIITAPIVFGRLHVLPVAIEFLKAYPDIDIRVALADRVVNLREDDIDLAIRIGDLPDSSLLATRVGSIRRVVCGSPPYFAQRGTPKSPGDLCITFDGLMSPDAPGNLRWASPPYLSRSIRGSSSTQPKRPSMRPSLDSGSRASSRTRSQARSEPARSPLPFESSSRSPGRSVSFMLARDCCR